MSKIERHPAGTPCWVDLQTPDAEKARAFYGALLGWSWDIQGPEYGNYANALLEGTHVAGLGPIPEGAPPQSHWTIYLATEDTDATFAAALEKGATALLPPMDVGPFGRMAILQDPTGAAFGLWQAKSHVGTGVMGVPGATCWFEVNTPDAIKDRDFYAGLFGHEAKKMEGMDYYTLHPSGGDGKPTSGILQMTEEWEGIPPHWMAYFTVADADASAAQIKELGGQVKHGPFDTPFGRIVVAVDPFEAPFTVIQLPDEQNS